MFPHQHFIVAVVPVVAYVIVSDRRLPTIHLMGILFLGSQFPDLVDKPLAHQFVMLPSGRVFMHSIPIVLPFLLILGVYGWQTNRLRLSLAFGFAHLSHLFTDNLTALLSSTPQIPPELLWPILSPTASPVTPSWAGPGGIYVPLWTAFSIVVLSFLVVVLLQTEHARINTFRAQMVRTTYRIYILSRPSCETARIYSRRIRRYFIKRTNRQGRSAGR